MLTILALMGLASADELFVSTEAELELALTNATEDRTIWLLPGTYSTSGLEVDAGTFTIRALSPRTSTLRRGDSELYFMDIGGTANVSFVDVDFNCGGERCLQHDGQANVTLQGVVASSAETPGGGGIVRHDSSGNLVIRDSQFSDADGGNVLGANGGHIRQTAGNLEIVRSSFERGVANYGGAVYFDGVALSITDSTFDSNEAFTGGGLYVASGVVDLMGTWFRDNTAQSYGGAGYLSGEAHVDASVFCLGESTNALSGGGGLFLGATPNSLISSTISRSLFLFNDAGVGGALSTQAPLDRGLDLDVVSSSFVGNLAPDGGDIVHVSNYSNAASAFMLRDSNLSHSSAATPAIVGVAGVSSFENSDHFGTSGLFPDVATAGLTERNPGFFWPQTAHCTPQNVVPAVGVAQGAFVPGGLTDNDGDGHYYPLDCDDADPAVFLNAGNVFPSVGDSSCDGVDSDCDRIVDEGAPTVTLYLDADGDGAGDPSFPVQATCADQRQHLVDNDSDCDDSDPAITNVQNRYVDGDGDGFGAGDPEPGCVVDGYSAVNTDCDDGDDLSYPNAEEICDGVDNNCDLQVDEGARTTYFPDFDQDGFGDSNQAVEGCSTPSNYTEGPAGDCDDGDEFTFPGADELCDGVDNNCDLQVDEDVTSTFYIDGDGDGFGDPGETTEACAAPNGFADNDEDCDDADDARFPGNGETCDGIDNNCDLEVDEGVLVTYTEDLDGDLHGNPENIFTGCTPPENYIDTVADDCDDDDDAAFPGNFELCDGIDNNCDGDVDENLLTTFYADADGDLHGDAQTSIEACVAPPNFVGAPVDDCDDQDPDNFPRNAEACDTKDNNCDGRVDEGVVETYYADNDEDGFGDDDDTVEACEAPEGFVEEHGDCDDADPLSNPDGIEVCDAADNDCNGDIDDGAEVRYHLDEDGDGFGVANHFINSCVDVAGYVLASDEFDCDDTEPTAFPGGVESCDYIDNNCDGVTDEGVTTSFFVDSDEDGFGDDNLTINLCEALPRAVAIGGDCDDSNPAIHPDRDDNVCDGIDDDCDGIADDEAPAVTVPVDADGDGYGSMTVTEEVRCSDVVLEAVDCDDDASLVHPDAEEMCDDIDRDCDGNPEPDRNCDNPFQQTDDEDGKTGCGCSGAPSNAPWWVLAAPFLLVRRRQG